MAYPQIKLQTITADFAKEDSIEFYESLFNQISAQDISILVNNVGQYIGSTTGCSVEKIRDSVVVNTLPIIMMTKEFVMRYKSSLSNRKAIINVGSATHNFHVPSQAIYNSCKHYTQMLSVSENYNFAPVGTDILVVKPHFVSSGVCDFREVDSVTSTPEEVVKGSFRSLGHVDESYGSDKHIRYARFSNMIRHYGGQRLGRFWLDMSGGSLNKLYKSY